MTILIASHMTATLGSSSTGGAFRQWLPDQHFNTMKRSDPDRRIKAVLMFTATQKLRETMVAAAADI